MDLWYHSPCVLSCPRISRSIRRNHVQSWPLPLVCRREIFSTFLLDHLCSQQHPSLAEQAGFIRLAAERLGKEAALAFLPRLGFPAQNFHLENLLQLATLQDSALMALHQGSLHAMAARLMSAYSPADQERLMHVIAATSMGGNRQRRFLNLVRELCLRRNIRVEEVVNQIRDSLDNPRPAQAIIHALEQMVRPRSTAAKAEFQRFTSRLQLPAGARLGHTPAFEDDTITLS